MSTEHGIILYSFVVYHTEELRVGWLLKYVPFSYIQAYMSVSLSLSLTGWLARSLCAVFCCICVINAFSCGTINGQLRGHCQARPLLYHGH